MLNTLFQRQFETDLQLNDIFDFITERVSISEYAENFLGAEVESELSTLTEGMAPTDVFDKETLEEWFDEITTNGGIIDMVHGRGLEPKDVYDSTQIADSFSDEDMLKEVDIRLDDDQLIDLCEGRGLVFRYSTLAL